MISSCFLWLVYGLLKNEFKIYFTNTIGMILGIYYYYMFVQYAPFKSSTLPGNQKHHLHGIFVIVTSILFLAIIVPSINLTSIVGGFSSTSSPQAHYINTVEIIGNIAVILCICLFGSPLASLKVVLQTKSAKSIPTPFTIATIINCFCWYILGVYEMNYDYNVIIPNLLGLIFGLIQISLKYQFRYNDRHSKILQHQGAASGDSELMQQLM